ncbi:unnamed protein product [Neospora caninum Liverpool]|uniref:Rhoptry antigen ROP8, related n=1 Tax=Neospora caninum (strain Liverpool) TaxID=572307 RepID=F0V897_NEOCL|nr:uncharacterized protein NCLIV_004220 [Neospora caninum Liverpool]CBZ49938.1 unnamed protein product [Neospora caninum Liverpool]CEL64526.1 TPA: Rhoptry antigen ROP8, related [Neospora caninum Liverpool]|eukprot:XP_003879973.1 uncharacterized protein NCLIV_004220 [Neospora caninum Liverpool]
MRTHVALLLAAAGSVSLGFGPQATLGAPVQVPLAPDMPEDAPGTGAPAPYAEVPLSTGDGNDEAVPVEAPVAQDQLPQPAVQQAPGRRMLGWLNPSRWWSPFRRGARSAVSEPEQAVGGPGVVGGTTSPSEEQVMGQPEGLRSEEPRRRGFGTRMRNWATTVTRPVGSRGRRFVNRVRGLFGRARRYVGRGWRRLRRGFATAADRVRGRVLPRAHFEFRDEEAVGQSALASLATTVPVETPDADALETARDALVQAGATLKFVSTTTAEEVVVNVKEPLGTGEYTAVFRGQVSGTDSDVALKFYLGQSAEARTVAKTEANILSAVSMKDAAEAMMRLRLVAPIDKLVYRPGGETDDPSARAQVLLMPKASSSLKDIIAFLRTSETLGPRTTNLVRLAATVQMVQLVAALHSRRVIHGNLQPKHILLFSHGLFYLSGLGRARRHGESFRTTRVSRYAAPEAVEHPSTPYTYSRDSYPLGLMIYELWCGRLPFDLEVSTFDGLDESGRAALADNRRSASRQLSFEACSEDIPAAVQLLIRNLLGHRRWSRLVPQAALRDASFREIVQLLRNADQVLEETGL